MTEMKDKAGEMFTFHLTADCKIETHGTFHIISPTWSLIVTGIMFDVYIHNLHYFSLVRMGNVLMPIRIRIHEEANLTIKCSFTLYCILTVFRAFTVLCCFFSI